MNNILIIEDNPDRFEVVREALTDESLRNAGEEVPLFAGYNVFPGQNEYETFCDAISTFASTGLINELYFYIFEYIEKNNISAVFSDLSLSMKEESGTTSGELLIAKLLQNKLHEDIPLVVYSRNKDSSTKLKEEIRAKIYYIYMGDSSTDALEIRRKFSSIIDKGIFESKIKKYHDKPFAYNLSILCALNKEFNHIKDLEDKWERKKNPSNQKTYYETFFKNSKSGVILKVIARSMNDDIGKTNAILESKDIIYTYNPCYIAMTGIAGGFQDNDLCLGDVVIVRHTWDWEEGKYKEGKFLQRPNPFIVDKKVKNTIKEDFLEGENGKQQLKEIQEAYKERDTLEQLLAEEFKTNKKMEDIYNKRGGLDYHFGPVATGSAVVADKHVADRIKEQNDRVGGLEMEIYSIYKTAYEATIDTKAIAIKGIVDYIDGNKGDKFHDFASYASARTLYKLFTEYIDVEKI